MIAPEKLPPQNLDAERGVLGSILLDNDKLHDVAPILQADDFYRDAHQEIYRAILDLHGRGRPIDPILLIEELERRGRFEAVGGDETIAGLLKDLNHAANARYYAEIVADKATRRALQASALETLREIGSDLHTAAELIELAERRGFAIGQGRTTPGASNVHEASRRSMEAIDARKEGRVEDGIPSGIGTLDELLGGFRPGQMIVLAGRPSMGKTALAFNFAEHLAVDRSVETLFFSIEMGAAEIGDRFLVLRSGVPMKKVQQPVYASDDDMRRLAAAVADNTVPLWIDDSPTLSASQVAALARRHRHKHGLKFVIVDYLQLVQPDNPREPRHDQVAGTSRRIKALAKELGVPVLALAQLNRDSEKRPDNRPMLSDLRESGQIEQDADVVLLVHRPEYDDKADRPGIAELIVAKNRNGSTRTIELVFEKELMRFSDAARERERYL